jgi:peptide chain release factor 1
MNKKTNEALETMKKRIEQIDLDLQSDEILSNIKKMTELNKERATLEAPVAKYNEFLNLTNEIAQAKEILANEKDEELREFAKLQITESEEKLGPLEDEIQLLLLPRDPNDDKNVIFEIRERPVETKQIFLQVTCTVCTYATLKKLDEKLKPLTSQNQRREGSHKFLSW